jgi:hypothetical protein
MADMPKPNFQNASNAPKPQAAPAPKAGGIKKTFGTIVLVALVGLGGSIWWHGKTLGEARAKAENKPLAEAKNVMFWEWTSDEWRGWYSNVESTAGKVGDAASAKAAALKAKVDAWRAERAGATVVSTPPTTPSTTPAATPPTTPPDATPVATPPVDAGAPPAGYADAEKLVDEGQDAWGKHDFATAKPKLVDAVKALKAMPAHPKVTKTLELATQLLEDIEENSAK